MSAFRSGLVAVALLAGHAGSVSAQGFAGRSVVANGYSVGVPGYGYNTGYGNYGYGGGYSGYRNPYYGNPSFQSVGPQTYNNMGGLINTIRTQTGRGNSFSYGSNYGITTQRRRVR